VFQPTIEAAVGLRRADPAWRFAGKEELAGDLSAISPEGFAGP